MMRVTICTGPSTFFDLASSHFTRALIRRAHLAKASGVHLMKAYLDRGHVNVGAGDDLTIPEWTRLVCDFVGFDGSIVHDLSKPDETPHRLISIDKIRALGRDASDRSSLGVASTYEWFLQNAEGGSLGRAAGAFADA